MPSGTRYSEAVRHRLYTFCRSPYVHHPLRPLFLLPFHNEDKTRVPQDVAQESLLVQVLSTHGDRLGDKCHIGGDHLLHNKLRISFCGPLAKIAQ
jgi:hypothetical protein